MMQYLLGTNIFYHLADRIIKIGQLPMMPPYKFFVSPLSLVEIMVSDNTYDYRKGVAFVVLMLNNIGLKTLHDNEFILAKHLGLDHLIDEKPILERMKMLFQYFCEFGLSSNEDNHIREVVELMEHNYKRISDKWLQTILDNKIIVDLILKINKEIIDQSVNHYRDVFSDSKKAVLEVLGNYLVERVKNSYNIKEVVNSLDTIPESLNPYIYTTIEYVNDIIVNKTKVEKQDMIDLEQLIYINVEVDCLVTNDTTLARLIRAGGHRNVVKRPYPHE